MIIQRFQDQVQSTPSNLAVKCRGSEYTYARLNRYANRIAHRLIDQLPPIPAEGDAQRVALLFDHGVHMIAAILGTLKAGRAYVPLSPDYPLDRLAYMVENSGSFLVLTHGPNEHLAGQIAKECGVEILSIREDAGVTGGVDVDETVESRDQNPGIFIPGDYLAYIMYTSGSTGRPKGVMQNHQNVLYYCDNWIRVFELFDGDRMTLFSSFCHDGSVQDMLGALLCGASLFPLNIRDREGMEELVSFLEEEEITIWHSVPSLYTYFLNTLKGNETLKNIRYFLLGGEPVRQYEIDRTAEAFPHAVLANVYGATESSVSTIRKYYAGDAAGFLTIGEPLDQTEIVVIDAEGGEVDEYEVGEIMVACSHLSPGYWQNEEATRKSFSIDPEFGPLYFTGDLGRLLPGGKIEFMGRRDFQVKIRGFRIELGEIETGLLLHESVSEAVVVARDVDEREKILCCYYVLDKNVPGEAPTPADLQSFLASRVPDYMVPPHMVPLETFPLTQSGKIDRAALPEPRVDAGGVYTAPVTAVEKALTVLWAAVLKLEPGEIGIDHNFFQLGGHSLKAASLVSMIHQEFDVRLPVTRVFRSPSIRELGTIIANASQERFASIEPAPPLEFYPLSSPQKRLYILQEMDDTRIGYNLPGVFILEGPLDTAKLQNAVNRAVQRHESLRTVFPEVDDKPVQQVCEDVDIEIRIHDREDVQEHEDVLQFVKRFIRPFDLGTGPLLRVEVLHRGQDDHLLFVDMHHIVTDGISMTLFIREIMSLYGDARLEPLAVQYKDYCYWLTCDDALRDRKAQEEYWTRVFSQDIPVLNLPADFPRPAVQRFEGDRRGFYLDETVTRQLKAAAQDADVTMYILLLALYNVFLSRLSAQPDIVVGTAVSGRYHEELQPVIGMFVNTLALWNRPAGTKTFETFLQDVRTTTMAAFDNQEYQFEELVEKVNVRRDISRNPLFDAMFRMQNFGLEAEDLQEFADREGLSLRYYNFDNNVSKFDISLAGVEARDRVYFKIEYSTNLFKAETIDRWMTYFKTITASALENPHAKLSQLDIMGEEEKQKIVEEFNATAQEFPRDKTIHQMFMEQAQRTPDAVALSMHGTSGTLTYRQYDDQTARLAGELIQNGVQPGDIVAIKLERSIHMMLAIMAILKTGAAYLPIEPHHPAERISYILKDSNAKLVVSTPNLNLESNTPRRDRSRTCLSTSSPGIVFSDSKLGDDARVDRSGTCPYGGSDSLGNPLDAAYVIYTSGSTGKPKGVMVEHRSVINRLHWMQRFYPLGPGDTILQKTTYVFDVSVWELFWWSFYGASLCLLPYGEEKNPASIASSVGENKITAIHFVPSMLGTFLHYLREIDDPGLISPLFCLRYVFASGEALGVRYVNEFNRLFQSPPPNHTPPRLINLYGPTEATVDVSYYHCPEGEHIDLPSIPIGRPIDNTQLYIFNPGMSLQPIGVAGELYIAGTGLAKGYLNRPALTADKFFATDGHRPPAQTYTDGFISKKENEFASFINHQSSIITFYRTGDLARWLGDGNIEFLGRIDYQVKIRGFRIELGEIEERLLLFPGVSGAAVLVWGDDDPFLCGYVVGGVGVDDEVLKEHLGRVLPDYMVPGHFVYLDEMPLTGSGKIDRKQLPAPEIGGGAEYRGPRNDVEERLVEIWAEALGIDADVIGIDHNFFDLGGHSLKAALVAARVMRVFNVDLSLTRMFQMPMICDLAAYIKGTGPGGGDSFFPAPVQEFYPLTPAQKRLFILNRFEGGGVNYNLPMVYRPAPGVEREDLETALVKMIERHESFRTGFVMKDDIPVQRVVDEVPFQMHFFPASGRNREVKSFIAPFDLSVPPLLRGAWFEDIDGGPLVVIDMHHIVSDGISIQVFLRDLSRLVKPSQSLPLLTVQYKDYAYWRNSEEWNTRLTGQKEYWTGIFSGTIPVLELQYDFHRPEIQSYEGNRERFRVGTAETGALMRAARKEDVTLFMFLLGIFNVLLHKLGNQEDIVVGTAVSGRQYESLEPLIGMFVNTLPIRNFPTMNTSFRTFLSQVKTSTLQAFENQEYPFEELVEQVVENRDVGRNPIFDAMFAYLPFQAGAVEEFREIFLPYRNYQNTTSKFDITLSVSEIETGGAGAGTGRLLVCNFEYCTRLFKKETIQRFISYFQAILKAVTRDTGLPIGDIDCIPPAEREKLLYEFNDTSYDQYPLDRTITGLFQDQVLKTPGNTALIVLASAANPHGQTMTYEELNREASKLARRLSANGVSPGSIAAVMIERSIEMMIGIYGILKTGAAYLPIDPNYPVNRIEYLLKDSAAALLVTAKNQGPLTVQTPVPVVYIDDADAAGAGTHAGPGAVPEDFSSSSLAYVIYTSGSTGKPKGVMVEHCSVVNRLFWMQRRYPLTGGDVILQKTTIAFDVSVWELFWWSFPGSPLCLLHPGGEKNPGEIVDAIQSAGVTTIHFVPSMLNAFLEYLEDTRDTSALQSLRRVFASGEALPLHHAERFDRLITRTSGARLINLYGPTEATVDVTYFDCPESIHPDSFPYKSIPIGKPIDNTQLYIFDKQMNLQPLGVPGELHIAGTPLARGYLNRPALTADKFFATDKHRPPAQTYTDGFISKKEKESTTFINHQSSIINTLYRTGDLARWLDDGNIEYLGRIDHQVKIRGFRIELGEIENRLVLFPGVKGAAVSVWGDDDPFLCGYVVGGGSENEEELKEFLGEALPEYMVPGHFVYLDEMPLTGSGKIDRKRLPAPEIGGGMVYCAPRNDVEKRLTEIWAEALGVETEVIGIDHNFFHLGGHSLKAVIVASRVLRVFNVNVNLTQLFKTPVIRGLAQYIEEAGPGSGDALPPAPLLEYYPLTSAQKRLYILNRLEGSGTNYNLSMVYRPAPGLKRRALEAALIKMVERHESFRTAFVLKDDIPVQQVVEDVDFKLDYFPGSSDNSHVKSFIALFDLPVPPLLRAAWFDDVDGEPLVVLDMHHIVSDGISVQVFLKDLAKVIREPGELPPLVVQYKDYAYWQQGEEWNTRIMGQKEYWTGVFSSGIPVLELPYDFPRPEIQSFEGNLERFIVGTGETTALMGAARQENVTLFMFLLGIFNVLLHKLGNREDIVVGTAVAGRGYEALEPVIGMFVNTLPIRNTPNMDDSFQTFLSRVKQSTLGAFENQEYPFEELVEQVVENRDVGRNPLFDVMFAYLPFQAGDVEQFREIFLPYRNYQNTTSKFDLTLSVSEIETAAAGAETERYLACSFEYCTRLFRQETIKRFISYFQAILNAVTRDTRMEIGDIDCIPPAEREKLLYEFNDTGKTGYPLDRTLTGLFRDQVDKTPGNAALIDLSVPVDDSFLTLSYIDFYSKIIEAANRLHAARIGSGSIVAVITHRSVHMLTALYSIQTAGAAYLPVSPDTPVKRIRYMLRDSNAAAVMTTSELARTVEQEHLPVILLDQPSETGQTPVDFPGQPSTSPAYCIYTSGSTGNPKGVLVEHRSVINRLSWLQHYDPLDGSDVVMQKTAFTFDVSVWELFGWSFTGAALCLLETGAEKNPADICRAVSTARVTTIHFVPSMLSVFLDYLEDTGSISRLSTLCRVYCSGEALTLHHVNRFNQLFGPDRSVRLVNLYGPTEASIEVSYFECPPGSEFPYPSVPIGKPIHNTQLYILDKRLHLQPLGVPGELHIAGTPLARGYLNRPGLTAEMFGKAHSSKLIARREEKDKKLTGTNEPSFPTSYELRAASYLYRTGDLARWLDDGNIEYLGRIDHQVKIRGFRIELGEIEAVLLDVAGVREAVVIDRKDNRGELFLCGYVVLDSPGRDFASFVEVLREYLGARLPGYMVPAFFVPLEAMPLSRSGKLDRKALPAPDVQAAVSGMEFAEPRTAMEETVAAAWKEVLGLETVGIHDPFFRVGGNSLNILQVNRRLRRDTGTEVPVVAMFRYTTVSALAAFLDTGGKPGENAAEQNVDRAETVSKAKDRRIRKIKKHKKNQR